MAKGMNPVLRAAVERRKEEKRKVNIALQMAEDAEAVLLKIHEEYDDLLPFDDKAEPEKIREVFGLSKAAFKRAVGRLYKEKKIVIEEGRIVVL